MISGHEVPGAAFTSNLTSGEAAALRQVGFEPAGQVFGSAVYRIAADYTWCNYYQAARSTRYRPPAVAELGRNGSYQPRLLYAQANRPFQNGQERLDDTSWVRNRPTGPASKDRSAPVEDMPQVADLLERARRAALDRMRQECTAHGGDGIIAVRLQVRSIYRKTMEFTAIGTAVRALPGGTGRTGGALPFTSNLSGQDFAKLLHAGHLPVALVLGVGAVIRHDDRATYRQRWSWRNQEMAGYTELMTAARTRAREKLAADAVRHGGDTVLLRDMELRTYRTECEANRRGNKGRGRDHVVEATLWGTSVIELPKDSRPPAAPSPLAILRLDNRPERRTRARARQQGHPDPI